MPDISMCTFIQILTLNMALILFSAAQRDVSSLLRSVEGLPVLAIFVADASKSPPSITSKNHDLHKHMVIYSYSAITIPYKLKLYTGHSYRSPKITMNCINLFFFTYQHDISAQCGACNKHKITIILIIGNSHDLLQSPFTITIYRMGMLFV